jgi:RNA polymerase sigma-70 factor (ECF subfamily)
MIVFQGHQVPVMERQQIISSLRERILGFAALRLGRDMAEDVAQEVLMVLHKKYSHLENLEDLVPLSFKIARFVIVALRRKHKRRGEYPQEPIGDGDIEFKDYGSNPDLLLERKDMAERLRKAFKSLGPRCKEIFRMKLEGMNFIEIQDSMKVTSVNTVYTWDSRCRKQLLKQMGGTWEMRQ